MGKLFKNFLKNAQRTSCQKSRRKNRIKGQEACYKSSHKVYFKPRFFRPTTKSVKRSPKLLKQIKSKVQLQDSNDPLKVILWPVTSDKNQQKMENENTLSFVVATWANKTQIANAFVKLHNAKIRSVNTLIRPDGKKKAYITLAPSSDSLKIASKIG